MPHMFFTLQGEYLSACESDAGTRGAALALERLTPIAVATVDDRDMVQLWQISPTGRISSVQAEAAKQAVIGTIREMQREGGGE